MSKILFITLLVGISVGPSTAFYIMPSNSTYSLVKNYSGLAFFEDFDFFTDADPTNGFVKFVDEATANATGMAGTISTPGNPMDGAVYLGVDSTNVTPAGRPSIRLSSNQTYNHGLFILDVSHMPGGICGVWPAFWLLGTSSPWPAAGEIDILEGVNEQTVNRMTLHTNAGVSVSNSSATLMKGTLITPNCDVNDLKQDKNAGCAVDDQANQTSYGSGFNANGGGVFATEYTSKGIKIWFFPRNNIPADIKAGAPNPSNGTWGTPNALFANDNVNLDAHFCEMQIVFDTTFCGDWAGKTWADSTCADKAPTCEDFVSNNPGEFKNAYWAINGLTVYQQANDNYSRKAKRNPPSP